MTGQRIGYVRVSTFDQNPDRQLQHIDGDRIFTDRASGRDVRRPQLKARPMIRLGWGAANSRFTL